MAEDLEVDDLEIIMKVIVVGNGQVSVFNTGGQDEHDHQVRQEPVLR